MYNEKDGKWYIQQLEEVKTTFAGKTAFADDITKAQELIDEGEEPRHQKSVVCSSGVA